ncbi:MAG: hypothetical protein OHK0012_28160 [Synechococcales cyanobacterium]
MRVMGLMSGTSADGVDVAIVELFGRPPQVQWRLLFHQTRPFDAALQTEILACCDRVTGTVDRLCVLNGRIGEVFADAALDAIAAAGLTPAEIDLIGSHGQTVWHQPQDHVSLQVGETAIIAERTGIPVIGNFRARDLACGGQGAPLVAYGDSLLFRDPQRYRAIQNIGGMANVTWLPPSHAPEDMVAFDTGPGNVLIDATARHLSQGRLSHDPQGSLAAQGRVDEALVQRWLGDPYFQLPPPKTTGREYWFWEKLGIPTVSGSENLSGDLSGPDLMASLTAFTARSIAQSYHTWLPRLPDEVIVSGGGSHNPTLLRQLQEALHPIPVVTSDHYGLPSAAREAVCFALLAYESYYRRPGTVPRATGATHAAILGHLTPVPPPPPLPTEGIHPRTRQLHRLSTPALVEAFNREDAHVAWAVAQEQMAIASAMDAISARMQQGGRLIYVGAGTSGRLGVLDAAECPPTFNSSPQQVMACIAGGGAALTAAIEGAEDDRDAGSQAMDALHLSPLDSVIGIAASGTTPYVLAALARAKHQGSLTVALTCNAQTPLSQVADLTIAPLVGAEVISGSTRLKAGTAQKMVLNMISSGVMIRLGKTYGNLMVDVQATNDKLRRRARNLVALACDLEAETAQALLDRCQGEVKTAILCHLRHWDPETARQQLQTATVGELLP